MRSASLHGELQDIFSWFALLPLSETIILKARGVASLKRVCVCVCVCVWGGGVNCPAVWRAWSSGNCFQFLVSAQTLFHAF